MPPIACGASPRASASPTPAPGRGRSAYAGHIRTASTPSERRRRVAKDRSLYPAGNARSRFVWPKRNVWIDHQRAFSHLTCNGTVGTLSHLDKLYDFRDELLQLVRFGTIW